jgi:hypothetical protein
MKRFVSVALAVLSFGVLLPVAAQAAVAIAPPPGPFLESESPGSVLIAHKFIRGHVVVGNTGGPTGVEIAAPRSEFEVGYACPPGTPLAACPASITVRAHWVCPGSKNTSAPNFQLCEETDWFFTITRHGKVYFSPEGDFLPTPNNQVSRSGAAGPGNIGFLVAEPPCDRGYLLMWVVTSPDDPTPISLNVLIGEAVIRNGDGSAGAYNMVPVASPLPPLTTLTYPLSFDGAQYQLLPTAILTDVRYDRRVTTGIAPAVAPAGLGAITTHLTVLTLDVFSNVELNTAVTLAFNAYNEQERSVSDSIEFVCWAQIPLSGANGINPQFTEVGRFSRKGLIESRDAFTINPFTGGGFAPRTVLGIVETFEHNTGPGSGVIREYSYNMFHPRRYFPTQFFPFFF